MNKQLVIFIFSILIFPGCEKNQIPIFKDPSIENTKPEIPLPEDFDINSDSVTDFVLKYSEWILDGVDTSYLGISGQIIPSKGNEVLKSENNHYLFDKPGDTIKFTSNDKFMWVYESHGSFLGFIHTIRPEEGNWKGKWEFSEKTSSINNYLVFKINNTNPSLLGWMKITLDAKSGKISVEDYKTTIRDQIVVGE